MKKYILVPLFSIILIAILVVTAKHLDYGYVLFTTSSWKITHSLSEHIVYICITFAAFYLATWIILRLLSIPSALSRRRSTLGAERARDNINRGLIELLEGHWQKAEQILLRDIDNSDNPLLNYLLAARAAQQLDANERRDEYLKKAHDTTPQADIAVGLTQAELQLAHEQTEQALATLTRLREIAPKHPYVLKLLSRLYANLNEWEKLAALLPELRKKRIVSGDKLLQLERTTYTQFLRFIARSQAVFSLEEQWKLLPRRYRNDPEILMVYIECLLEADNEIAAERTLRQYLNKHWDEKLVQCYGELELPNATQQLDFAEAWLKDHGRSPMLLLALARLCSHLRLWGKSRVYYESSIAIHPTSEAYAELAELLESLGESDSAYDCLRKGMMLANNGRHNRRISDQIHPEAAANDDSGDKISALN